ncbi:glyoxalase superfamily protein [Paenibacillus sp. FSL R5-0810]|uniref:glyoxalase superfamily protein n=1 Tax=Paenibacillus sp. FSL R5-0810 TaxID=2921659 RepID=UPI0030F91949
MLGIIPLFRIFDVDKAKEFYVHYLGFQIDWEHRFEDGAPLYMQVTKGEVSIHLTKHHGDCTPGSAVRIEMTEIEQYHAELHSKNYPYARPAVETAPWNSKEVCVTDPFGNRITFYEELEPS